MNIEIAIAPLIETLAIYIWPFVRIGAFLMVMPLIGGSFTPVRVRLILAIVLTIAIAPMVPATATQEVLSAAGLVMMIQEIGIGVAMGFLVQLVFDAIALGGQVIGMSMGLGFAVFLDRARGVSIPVLGQLFLMLAMLVFLSMDGHLAMIQLLVKSFRTWPMSGDGLTLPIVSELLAWTGQLFIFALKIALPAITALLVVNLSFGIMSRAAPTLNLFAVGFPVAMLLGFTVIFLNMGVLIENVSAFLTLSISKVSHLLELQAQP
ncbi:MAG: flagellar biosynthetic protein FliR [Gammaproteobacteria bacterium]|nr:flagellar biosynthetic protein FliR [Gammaproteobacteria bacterium]